MAVSIQGTAQSALANSASPSVTFSAGYTPATNDVIVIWTMITVNTATLQAVAGWVNPLGGTTIVGSGTCAMYCAYHLVTSAEASAVTRTYTVTNETSATRTGRNTAVALRGVDTTTVIDSSNTSAISTTITPHVLPGLTGANLSTGSQVITGIGADGTGTYTTPAGWTLRDSTVTTITCYQFSLNTLTTAGVNVASTNITPSVSDESAAITLAFTALVKPKTNTLTDDFTTKDTAKWTWGAAGAVVNGQASFTPTIAYTGDINSVSTYDFTGSSVSVRLVQPPNVGNATVNAALQLISQADVTDTETIWWGYGNTLHFMEAINGTKDETSIAYDPVAHAYLRIRESGGTIFWDTSPDGATWTNRRSKTAGAIDLTSVNIRLYAGYDGTEPSPGIARFDNFNLSVPLASSLTDEFTGTLDLAKWAAAVGTPTVSGGRLALTTAGVTQRCASVSSYSLLGSAIFAKVVHGGSAGTTLYVENPAGEYTQVRAASGLLQFIENKIGRGNVTYDPVAHAWLRIRESAGTVYFDTAPDGVTWTNRNSSALTSDVSNVKLYCELEGGTGTSYFDHFNLSVPPTSSLTDDFTTKDTAKWDWYGTATVSGGQFVLPIESAYSAAIASKGAQLYDLTENSVFIQYTPPAVGTGTKQVAFRLNPDASYSNTQIELTHDGPNLNFIHRVAGVADQTSITFDPVAHQWWRMRESAGTIYWDTSPDGTTWTNRRSMAVSTITVTSVMPYILAGYYGTESASNAIFDNFNTLGTPAAPANTGQFFAMF